MLFQKEVFDMFQGKPKYDISQVRDDYLSGKKQKYLFFWGHHPAADGSITQSCLSQWWKADFQTDTELYCCMEQYMMAKKAELFHDLESKQQILACSDPKQIKALGRCVTGFDEALWNQAKYGIVLNGNYLKFIQNPSLKQFLLSTKNRILVEASPFDAVWGIKMAQNEKDVQNPLQWRGENLLGFALMEVRDEISEACQNEYFDNWTLDKQRDLPQ